LARIGVIEINDAGLVACDAGGVRLVSPGCAVVEDGAIVLGRDALARFRLNPRRSFDRFWDQLDQQPLARPAEPAHSHADFAYFHLQAVWEALRDDIDEVILAAPATLDTAQLSLLLGIAQACAIPVSGLVESSLAAAASVPGERPRLYLDAQLHRLVAARIDAGDGLGLRGVEELERRGLSALHAAWSETLAECFVRQTRFNPLRRAPTEQILYDQLPEWLATLRAQSSARLELPVGSRSHRIELNRAELAQAAAAFYQPLVEAAAATEAMVLLSHRLGALPGLVEAITERSGVAPMVLEADAPARAALASLEAVRGGEDEALAFVTHLPDASGRVTAPLGQPQRRAPRPTHVLHRWRAYPLGAAPLALPPEGPRSAHAAEAGAGCSLVVRDGAALLCVHGAAGAQVNGRTVGEETPLALGDHLRIGDEDMWLIAQVLSDGA